MCDRKSVRVTWGASGKERARYIKKRVIFFCCNMTNLFKAMFGLGKLGLPCRSEFSDCKNWAAAAPCRREQQGPCRKRDRKQSRSSESNKRIRPCFRNRVAQVVIDSDSAAETEQDQDMPSLLNDEAEEESDPQESVSGDDEPEDGDTLSESEERSSEDEANTSDREFIADTDEESEDFLLCSGE